MILLLGASGYYGRAFAAELRRRGHSFIPLTRRAFDYTRFDFLFDYLRNMKPVFLINAAGHFGPAGETAGTAEREAAMSANALLPQMIARVCVMTRIPWGHVASGCIYSGAKIQHGGHQRIERDLGRSDILKLFSDHPDRFRGFTEDDEPNFTFRHPPCGFYSGTKALAEEAIREIGQCYIWRLRLPFNEQEEPCNLLRQPPESVDDGINSLSHLDDCVRACLDLWEMRSAFGIYNVTNPGAAVLSQVLRGLPPPPQPPRVVGAEPPAPAARVALPNCVLDVSKLLQTGVKLRNVNEALEEAVHKLRSGPRPGRGNSSRD